MVKKKAPKGFAVYEENKSTKLHLTLTPTGLNLLNEMAEAASLSRSELVERLVRGTIDQGTPTAIPTTPELPAEVSQRLADQEQQLTEQRQTIAQLQQQIAQPPSQGGDPTDQVAQLQAQIAQLQADNQQRVDGAVVRSLQDTITKLKGELETLRSRTPADASPEALAQLQNLLDAERGLAASQLARALAAEAEVDRQIKERYQLERRLNSLQGLASIAETQLNRWRH